MTEIRQLLSVMKRRLKARGITYRDVGRALGLSEPTVKRIFASGRVSLERAAKLGALVDLTLAELCQEAAADLPRISVLTAVQECELVSDTKLLLVAACILNHWTVPEIVTSYRISELECLRRLLKLDRLRLIDLLPGNRVRLNIAHDFDWLPDGPIRRFFRTQWESDFLSGTFDPPAESLAFVHGMLTSAALAKLQASLRWLRHEIAALHEESRGSALTERHGTGVLLAVREWEPRSFAALRRAVKRGAETAAGPGGADNMILGRREKDVAA
ncbi:MAG TPA: helix-turn-helix transcriptional regulator [Casimicrobiaceae bacterium]|nr:helix-turn-helix transcriptional regulator [Casimicrobiaceae bacterium]